MIEMCLKEIDSSTRIAAVEVIEKVALLGMLDADELEKVCICLFPFSFFPSIHYLSKVKLFIFVARKWFLTDELTTILFAKISCFH